MSHAEEPSPGAAGAGVPVWGCVAAWLRVWVAGAVAAHRAAHDLVNGLHGAPAAHRSRREGARGCVRGCFLSAVSVAKLASPTTCYQGHSRAAVWTFVGGINRIWLVPPALGLYACARRLLEGSFDAFRR
jgi:hypothetical protein